jgi:lipid-A-disaccharide synthase
MHEYWRPLLYPLGFIASLLFTTRFLLQWIESEKRKQSYVTPTFWKTSLIANLLMVVHTFIQIQYPLCLIQSCNAVLSWRNLQLISTTSKKGSLKHTAFLLAFALSATTVAFIFQDWLFNDLDEWVRSPVLPWSSDTGIELPLSWHLLGFSGATLFALRFWIQWWRAEKKQSSYLGRGFWWTSLIGASLALIYFIRLGDWVNILGYATGLIPYARNIMLINQSKLVSTE